MPFLHFCPQSAIIEKLTLAQVMYEVSNSCSQHWNDFSSKTYSLLGMECQKYWDNGQKYLENERSGVFNNLPYGINFDLKKILLEPLQENLRNKDDNFAEDTAIIASHAIKFRMASLTMHNENATQNERKEAGDFLHASRLLIESLERSKHKSIYSNRVAYHCTPQKEYRSSVHAVNQLKKFGFILGCTEDKILSKLTSSDGNSDETITPMEEALSQWGVRNLFMLRGDGSSPGASNLTLILEEELKGPVTGSSTKKKRVSFTPQEREWVMNGVERKMTWSEILDQYPILRTNGKTEQNIKEMHKNQLKKERKQNKVREANLNQDNQETNHSPKKRTRYTLDEKLAVINGKARGQSWAEIIKDNPETLGERNSVNIKDLWRTITGGVKDQSILTDLRKLEDQVRRNHNSKD
jgi:hypothetical protein